MNYLILACDMIRHYLNVDGVEKFTDEYIQDHYPSAVMVVQENLKNMYESGNEGKVISSMSQGDISISYDNSDNKVINSLVRSLLPLPFVRTF